MNAPRTAAIEIRELCHRYRDKQALKGVNLSVYGPGVFGFLGLNGAGKSTTIRILNGFLRPTSGSVAVFGQVIGPARIEVRRRIGYLPQVAAFPGWMTASEYLDFAADCHGMDRRLARARSTLLLERLDLTSALHRRLSAFSAEMRQRLGFAQALLPEPELLLLDEPVSSLDPAGRVAVLEIITETGRRSTVFLSSPTLTDAERVCERVAILHEGRVLVEDQPRLLKERLAKRTFEIAYHGTAEGLRAALAVNPWVLEVQELDREGSRGALRLQVSDPEYAGRELPRILAECGLTLLRFELATPALEDVLLQLASPPGKPA